jgi:hypothetical protein
LAVSALVVVFICFSSLTTPTQGRELYFAYYGGDDHGETLGHVNLQFLPGWGQDNTAPRRAFINDRIIAGALVAQAQGVPVIIDLGHILFDFIQVGKTPMKYRWGDGVNDLYAFFQQLVEKNLTHSVRAFYPLDEPERDANIAADVIVQANAHIRQVAAGFPHLGNASLAVIYGDKRDYRGIGSYDWIGFDDYGAGDRIYNPGGEYDSLKAKLKPNQKTILVPGGYNPYRTPVAQSFAKAMNDPQVGVLMPFLWVTKDGIGNNGMAKQYCQAGWQISHPGVPINCG